MTDLVERLSLAAVVACVALIGATILVLGTPGWRAHFDVETSSSYQPGELIDLPPTVYNRRDLTLAVFADATCGASAASVSGLHFLVDAFTEQTRGQVMLVTSNLDSGAPSNDTFAKAIGVDSVDVYAIDLRPLRLRVVPAAAILDRRGTVLAFHEGYLTEARARALLNDLPKATSLAAVF